MKAAEARPVKIFNMVFSKWNSVCCVTRRVRIVPMVSRVQQRDEARAGARRDCERESGKEEAAERCRADASP